MIDISTVGAKISVETAGGGNFTITEFSDEGTPFESGNVDVSTNQKNLNGIMISSRTPSVYPVSLTVIPGSEADSNLTQILQKAAIQPGNVTKISDIVINNLTLSLPKIDGSMEGEASGGRNYVYTNGRIKSGPTGPSSSAQGRMSARTFSFEFEKFTTSGTGSKVS